MRSIDTLPLTAPREHRRHTKKWQMKLPNIRVFLFNALRAIGRKRGLG
jgi:hypothetical protein